MNLLLQVLMVAAVIALMIALRMLVGRQVMRQRLAGKAGTDCEEKECFGGCSGIRKEPGPYAKTESSVN